MRSSAIGSTREKKSFKGCFPYGASAIYLRLIRVNCLRNSIQFAQTTYRSEARGKAVEANGRPPESRGLMQI